MKTLIFSNYGIEIFRAGESYTVRYDAGHLTPKFREDPVSSAEATKAQESEASAYQVLLDVMRRQGI